MTWEVALVFVVLHLLIYPASNGFNSYFDKDEDSIGGLKVPPKVTEELYWVSLALDVIGTLLALVISWQFAGMVVIYGLVSKAYSHPSVRLKKYPIVGWLAAGIFQGYFTFMMTLVALSHEPSQDWLNPSLQFPAILSTMLLFGSYPMTQVYQHEEDSRRGDKTISLRLGILGTFVFTGIFFTCSVGGFWFYFLNYSPIGLQGAIVFQLLLLPVLVYFLRWFFQVRKDVKAADFERTMQLNWLSSMVFNIFFMGWWILV